MGRSIRRRVAAAACVAAIAVSAIFAAGASANRQYHATNSCYTPGGGIGNAYYQTNPNYHSAVYNYGYCYGI